MSHELYQKHMEDVADPAIILAMSGKEIAFNRVLFRFLYKHLDGTTIDYISTERRMALTTVANSGASRIGVDSAAFAQLVGTSSQALWTAVDAKIATLISGQANSILKDGSVAYTGDQSMGSNKITNLATPTATTDATTKAYVDALVSGTFIKADGSVPFTANQPMAGFSLTTSGGMQRADATNAGILIANTGTSLVAGNGVTLRQNGGATDVRDLLIEITRGKGDINILRGEDTGNINITNGPAGQGGDINISAGQNLTLSSSTGVILKGYSGGGATDIGDKTYSFGSDNMGADIWFAYALKSANYGITASVTQTQGNGPLTKVMNIVTTVANVNDALTLPAIGSFGANSDTSLTQGNHLFLKNNGANALQLFPALGASIDSGGTNASITLAAGAKLTLIIQSTTNWITF